MTVLLMALILISYIYGINYTFNKVTKIFKNKTNDYVVQIFPGWIIVALTSSLFIITLSQTNMPGVIYYQFIFFLSVGILLVLLFLNPVIKKIDLNKYHMIIEKIKGKSNE